MKEEEIKKLNIYEKLDLITNEIATVGKNLKVQVNKTASYNAVSERDIIDAVKPLEHKYRVYSYPVESAIIDKDVLVKETEYDGKITRTNSLFMRLERIYRFVNLDNTSEYVDIKSYGDGIDTGDKAPGKAMTYADKYALMKGYKISTGDDPDKEASPEQGYQKTKTKKDETQEINYRDELIKYCGDKEIDMNEVATKYKLNANSTNIEFKNAYLELKNGE